MAKQSAKIPGEVLQKSFLDEYGLTPAKTAQNTGLSQSAIRQILTGKTRISLSCCRHVPVLASFSLKAWVKARFIYTPSRPSAALYLQRP
jgi:plasmid maintenance system antidote protein VapI